LLGMHHQEVTSTTVAQILAQTVRKASRHVDDGLFFPVQVLVGTAKGRVRLYDTKFGRRPVSNIQVGSSRINAIVVEPQGALS
jgi:hypothetical protein